MMKYLVKKIWNPQFESSEAESDDSYGVPAYSSGSDKSVDTGDFESKLS